MMPSTDTSTREAPAALGADTLCEAFATTVRERPDQVALRTTGPDGVSLTWAQYQERVARIAGGLAARGVRRGDSVALLLRNVPEFHLIDTAALHLGASTLSLDPSASAEDLLGPLRNAGARIAVTEAAFSGTLAEAASLEPTLTDVVSIDGDDGATSSLGELEAAADPDFDLAAAAAEVAAGDVAVLAYAPGASTGAQHSHAGLLCALRATEALAPPTPGGRVVSHLPATLLAERHVSHYGALAFGHEVTCCPDPERLVATLAEVRPTRLLADPPTVGTLAQGIETAADTSPGLAAAVREGRDTVDAIQAGCPPQFHPGVGREAAEVLADLRSSLGLDELEWLGVATAPSSPEPLRLLHAVGLNALEFWGTAEAVFPVSNPTEGAKLGTVGTALPGVEVRLTDGELLVRSGDVMIGYRDDPGRTAEALDADGWLHTGVGATKDHDGFLTLAERR